MIPAFLLSFYQAQIHFPEVHYGDLKWDIHAEASPDRFFRNPGAYSVQESYSREGIPFINPASAPLRGLDQSPK